VKRPVVKKERFKKGAGDKGRLKVGRKKACPREKLVSGWFSF